jgi:hypothetical protein
MMLLMGKYRVITAVRQLWNSEQRCDLAWIVMLFLLRYYIQSGEGVLRGSAVCWGSALQIVRSRV